MTEAVHNKLLGDAVTHLEFRLRRYFMAVEWQLRTESMIQHRGIFEAIKAKDARLAERLTSAHIGYTEALAFRSVSTPGTRSPG
jgi:DNA-binding GntR family transcriptional regulator